MTHADTNTAQVTIVRARAAAPYSSVPFGVIG